MTAREFRTPVGRGADAQGTASIPAKRAGVRVASDRAQPEPKHRFGRWRRPATGCGAGVSNNQRCRTKKFRLACRRTGQGRCRRTGQGRCRRTAPHARSASPGSLYRQKNCSMKVGHCRVESRRGKRFVAMYQEVEKQSLRLRCWMSDPARKMRSKRPSAAPSRSFLRWADTLRTNCSDVWRVTAGTFCWFAGRRWRTIRKDFEAPRSIGSGSDCYITSMTPSRRCSILRRLMWC